MKDKFPRSLKKYTRSKGSTARGRPRTVRGGTRTARGGTRTARGRTRTARGGTRTVRGGSALSEPENLSEVNNKLLAQTINPKIELEYDKYKFPDKYPEKSKKSFLPFNEIIEIIEKLKKDVKIDKNIIPSLWSRFGDFSKQITYVTKIKDPRQKKNHLLITLYEKYVDEIMSKLKILSRGIPDSIPSAKDALLIDSKLDYMRLLLKNNLCDPDSIICYTHDDKLNNTITFLDKKSRSNFYKLKDTEQDFHIKVSFSGSSKCTLPIIKKHLFENFISEDNINEVFTNIEKKFVSSEENDDGEHEFDINCLGHKYGFIIQPKNKHFEPININNVTNFGEIRCFCYKGEIKSIAIDQREIYTPLHPPFQVIAVHTSYFSEKLKKFDGDNSAYLEQYNKHLKDERFLFSNIGINKTTPLTNNFKEKILNELISKCQQTYSILKTGLGLDGVHHRIDLIYKDDTNGYVVNEVENINYGENADRSLYLFGCTDDNYTGLITEIKSEDPVDEDKLKFFSIGNIVDLTKPGYVYHNRQILLTF